jgi:DNA polymerase V
VFNHRRCLIPATGFYEWLKTDSGKHFFNCCAKQGCIATASRLLTEIFKNGYGYQKCGVQLSDIKPESLPGQMELFDFIDDDLPTENRSLMKVVDQINRRFPKAISIAATGFDKSWKPKAERVS